MMCSANQAATRSQVLAQVPAAFVAGRLQVLHGDGGGGDVRCDRRAQEHALVVDADLGQVAGLVRTVTGSPTWGARVNAK